MDAFAWASVICAGVMTFVLYFGFYLPTKREREKTLGKINAKFTPF